MSRKDKTTVALPKSVALALRSERDRVEQACINGQRDWPEGTGESSGEIPLHAVLFELLAFKASHTNRSRRSRINEAQRTLNLLTVRKAR